MTWREHGIARGAAGALFMMACFGIGWSIMLVANWTNPFTIVAAVVLIGCAVFFYLMGVLTMRRLRTWRQTHADDPAPADVIAFGRRAARGFGILFGSEFGLIGVAVAACLVAGHWEYIIPLCVLIMGAHFFPFARLFRRRFDYFPGTLAMLIGIGGIVAAATANDPVVVVALMGLGGACCTTMYGMYDIWLIRKVMSTTGPQETAA